MAVSRLLRVLVLAWLSATFLLRLCDANALRRLDLRARSRSNSADELETVLDQIAEEAFNGEELHDNLVDGCKTLNDLATEEALKHGCLLTRSLIFTVDTKYDSYPFKVMKCGTHKASHPGDAKLVPESTLFMIFEGVEVGLGSLLSDMFLGLTSIKLTPTELRERRAEVFPLGMIRYFSYERPAEEIAAPEATLTYSIKPLDITEPGQLKQVWTLKSDAKQVAMATRHSFAGSSSKYRLLNDVMINYHAVHNRVMVPLCERIKRRLNPRLIHA